MQYRVPVRSLRDKTDMTLTIAAPSAGHAVSRLNGALAGKVGHLLDNRLAGIDDLIIILAIDGVPAIVPASANAA